MKFELTCRPLVQREFVESVWRQQVKFDFIELMWRPLVQSEFVESVSGLPTRCDFVESVWGHN